MLSLSSHVYHVSEDNVCRKSLWKPIWSIGFNNRYIASMHIMRCYFFAIYSNWWIHCCIPQVLDLTSTQMFWASCHHPTYDYCSPCHFSYACMVMHGLLPIHIHKSWLETISMWRSHVHEIFSVSFFASRYHNIASINGTIIYFIKKRKIFRLDFGLPKFTFLESSTTHCEVNLTFHWSHHLNTRWYCLEVHSVYLN